MLLSSVWPLGHQLLAHNKLVNDRLLIGTQRRYQ